MTAAESRVTVHMAASLDGFVARRDGRVDWLETGDDYPAGETLDPDYVREFLQSIDGYVMGARTYDTARAFAGQGHGWAYGDTPTFVLTHGDPPRIRDTVELRSGDLAGIFDRLRPLYRNIWIAGGGAVATDALRLGLADEIVWSVVPVLIGDGIRFVDAIGRDVALHLLETRAWKNGIVELRYAVRR